MIYTMSMEYVGLGSLFSSILSVLSFSELGIGEALVFSMYKPIAIGDDTKVCALLNFYKKAYQVIGTIILCLGLIMFPFLGYLIAGDVPDGINIQLLFSIYLLNNVLGYYMFAYKQSIFNASQRIDRLSIIYTFTQICLGICQIILLLIKKNYYFYVITIPIATCLNNIIVNILANKYYPQYKCKGSINDEELREIKKQVGGMVFQKIGGIVLSSVDTIVISAFLGLTSLGLYQNYYYIITSLFGFLSVIMHSIISVVGNCIAIDSVEKNYKAFKKFNLIYIWIVTWWTSCLLCLYQPFMKIWVGEKRMFGSEMVILFSIYFFVNKWCDMLYVYQEASGIWWETKFVPLAAAIVNLSVNILLVKKIGLPGILLSTIVSVIFIYNIGYAKVLFKTYFKSVKGLGKYWTRQCIYLCTALLVCIITMLFCNLFKFDNNVLKLISNGLICMIIPNIIMILCWFKFPEFNDSVILFKNIIEKNFLHRGQK